MIGSNEWETIKKEVVIDWSEVYTHRLFAGSEENSDNSYKSLTFREPCIVIYSYNKSQQYALFLNFILVKNSTCIGQIYCPSSGVLILYSQQLL
jgi:hypothetical protein